MDSLCLKGKFQPYRKLSRLSSAGLGRMNLRLAVGYWEGSLEQSYSLDEHWLNEIGDSNTFPLKNLPNKDSVPATEIII